MTGAADLWFYWLLTVTVAVIAFSLGLIFLPGTIFAVFNLLSERILQDALPFGALVERYVLFLYAVLGGVMAGWALLLLLVLAGPFRRGEAWAWTAIAASVGVWFVLDSSASAYYGFFENVAFNIVFGVLFAIPLGATRSRFTGGAAERRDARG